MTTMQLDPGSLVMWQANIKEMERRQPWLAKKLLEWVDVNGHSFEHDETTTPAGTWISGLTSEPFFQPSELPERPWRKDEQKNAPLVCVCGVGVNSWLIDTIGAVPEGPRDIVVMEPNIALLAYILHTANIYDAAPKGCRLSFAVDAGEPMAEGAFLINAEGAKVWAHPGEAEAFRESFAVMQKALRERVAARLYELDRSAEAVLFDFRRIAMAAPWIVFGPPEADGEQGKQGKQESPAGKWLTGDVLGCGEKPEERAEIARQVLERVEKEMSSLESAREKLKTVKSELERVSAPALAPHKRRAIAVKMFAGLDELHRSNPVLEHIGRSRMTLNAGVISGARSLEDVFAVAELKKVYQEIIEGHHAALDFMENWLKYAAVAVEKISIHWNEGYSLEPLFSIQEEDDADSAPVDPAPYEEEFMVVEALELFEKIAECTVPDDALGALVLLDNLLARADHKWWYFWDKRIDWKLALAMEQEGRVAEARNFIRRMEHKSMKTFGLPHEAGIAFMKDAARIFSSSDVLCPPDFDEARIYIQNALEHEPDDPEAAQILRDINSRALRYYTGMMGAAPNSRSQHQTPERVAAEWRVERARAEQAMSEKDLASAFDIVWGMVRKFVHTVPDGASDYLRWLTTHIAKAEREGLELENVPAIKREIAEWMPQNFGHIAEETAATEQPLAEQG